MSNIMEEIPVEISWLGFYKISIFFRRIYCIMAFKGF
jgi:hypothetical protein